MATETKDYAFTPDRVKGIRIQMGISQEEFARKLGVSANAVGSWETGQATPTSGRILKALLDAEAEANGAN